MKFFLKIALLIPILGLWVWALIVEPYTMLEIDTCRVFLPDWDAKLNGLKVAVIGDIHAGRGIHEEYRLKKIVEAVNSQNPDVVMMTGDYVNGSFYQTVMKGDTLSKFLREIKAPKVGAFGNHDIYFGKEKVRKILEDGDVKVVENSSVKVSLSIGEFYAAGIDDPITSDYFYKRTLKNVPKDASLIFLSHSPDVFRELPARVDFMLSGHTHGGQVRIPFLGAINTNSNLNRRKAFGWILKDGKVGYVTSGLGTSRIPVRFFCPPQITIIEVYKGDMTLNSTLRK